MNEKDDLDNKLYEYFDKTFIDEIPPNIQKMADETCERIGKKNKTLYNLRKIAMVIISIGILGTGVVFAKDIINFISSLFNNSTEAINTAIENGYVQNVEMDFVFDNNVGIKVEYLTIDDTNLDVLYYYKTDEEVSLIELNEYTIKDEQGNLYYENIIENNTYETPLIINKINTNNKPVKIDDNTFRESYLYSSSQFPNSKKLIFNITSLKINGNEVVNGNWNFEISLDDKFINREIIYYECSQNENIIDCTAFLTEISFIIELEINEECDYEFLHQNIPIIYNTYNEELNNTECKINNLEGKSTYYLKYDISKYNENLDELYLYLKIREDKEIKVTLNK